MVESPTLSIVIPAYFEEGNIELLYDKLLQVLKPLVETWELIIVDDGSTDNTWRIISQLSAKDKGVIGLRLSRNFGHQYALFAGLKHARGKAVISMDADLQHPPKVIPWLLEEWRNGYQIVHTVRIDHKKTPISKQKTSKLFYKLFSYLSGVKISEGLADFRLLDRLVVNEILRFKEGGLFLRGIVHWVGYKSTYVDYQCQERHAGESKYNFRRMLRFAWAGITAFSLIPLRIAVIIGLLTSLFAFYQLFSALYIKFFTNLAVPGWTSIITLVALLFGVLFILLGIIGEYIARILEEVRDRPRYIISEQVGLVKGYQGLKRNCIEVEENLIEGDQRRIMLK